MAKKQAVNGERGRWSAKAKREAVVRLLRGEAIDTLSRELKVTAAKLSEWREAFLAGGEANLKSRDADARDDELRLFFLLLIAAVLLSAAFIVAAVEDLGRKLAAAAKVPSQGG